MQTSPPGNPPLVEPEMEAGGAVTSAEASSASRISPLIWLMPSWVAVVWLVSRAQWFWNHHADLQFGWIVLLLCGYLFFEAYEHRPPLVLEWRWPSLALAGLGLGLILLAQIFMAALGTIGPSFQAFALGTLLLVAANLQQAFGWRGVRHFMFPFAFILTAIPLPLNVYQPIVQGLQSFVTSMTIQALGLTGVPAHQVGSLIHLPNCTVGVDEACSGIRSLQSTVMATMFIGYLTLKRNGLRALLLVAGVALAIVGNLARSFILSRIAYGRGIAALERFHDTAGWSILFFTVAGVGLIAWSIARLEKVVGEEMMRKAERGKA